MVVFQLSNGHSHSIRASTRQDALGKYSQTSKYSHSQFASLASPCKTVRRMSASLASPRKTVWRMSAILAIQKKNVIATLESFLWGFLLLSSFDSTLVDIPCIVSGIGSTLLFFPLTYTLDLLAAALHLHKCTKAHFDFDPQLLSVIVYMYSSNHFLPLKQSSWNLSRYLNLEKIFNTKEYT